MQNMRGILSILVKAQNVLAPVSLQDESSRMPCLEKSCLTAGRVLRCCQLIRTFPLGLAEEDLSDCIKSHAIIMGIGWIQWLEVGADTLTWTCAEK